MNSGKGSKKITITTGNPQSKRPQLELNLTHEVEPNLRPAVSYMPIDENPNNYKSISTVTSPSNQKFILQHQPLQDSGEFDPNPSNVNRKGGVQKRPSDKDRPVMMKVEPQQSKMPVLMGGLGSPKLNAGKEKILVSFASEKNLGSMRGDKKQVEFYDRDSRAVRIEELQKIVEQSKMRASELQSKEGQLIHVLELLRNENIKLREENSQLHKKIQKYKQSNQQTKKMLKQRIHSFNEQGQELKTLRGQIHTLQERVQHLLQQNQTLKTQLNKYSDYNLKGLISQVDQPFPVDVQGPNLSMVTSTVREIALQGSRISQIYLKQSGQADLLQFNNMQDVEQNLNLQSYISQNQQSYLEQFKNNVQIFDKIKQEYEEILNDIDIRYKAMAKQYENAIAAQAGELYDLQLRHDQLQQKGTHEPRSQSTLSLHLDQIILKNQQQIAGLNVVIYDLRSTNKQLTEDIEHHRAQCRFLQAELDIQRMKKKFKNQNDKFEYNVVKLNLLSIIDKLKMQIDKEKSRFQRLIEKCQAKNNAN